MLNVYVQYKTAFSVAEQSKIMNAFWLHFVSNWAGKIGEFKMTKQEAIEAMKSGAKVTHRYFSDEEWITMEGNLTVITAEGYAISSVEFWKYRQGEAFETDWAIWSSQ